MASSAADVRPAVGPQSGETNLQRPPGAAKRWLALLFLAPALFLLGAIVVYPTIDTIAQSFQDDTTRSFVGLDNYQRAAQSDTIVTAIKNNAIWVLSAPAIITSLGLMFAVLTERVKFATAIKIIVFMPMAISFLATGVIWRVTMYEPSPELGLLNAVIGKASEVTGGAGGYPTARVLPDAPVEQVASGAVVVREPLEAGGTALVGLTAIAEGDVPADAVQAVDAEAPQDGLAVVVWRDFKPGGGEAGVVEDGEVGLPGAEVQVLDSSGEVVASDVTAADGTVTFEGLGEGPFTPQVAASTFSEGFTGIRWLGADLVTPAIIAAFCWMWGGFALVVIGAGLSALPRDVLEAARVDGANEWQTFRHVTFPLLAPVLGVVFVTMVINVLKIFDIILMAPGASQDEANVIALEMYRSAFTSRQYGLGSVIAVLIFVLVIPIMILNIRRFRRED
ncbi:MAG TPA: ABC transporter permease subunit [Actinomycetota bacterium]|nr:ABC transporter permease subunit [Actinomycetota bacterium]